MIENWSHYPSLVIKISRLLTSKSLVGSLVNFDSEVSLAINRENIIGTGFTYLAIKPLELLT